MVDDIVVGCDHGLIKTTTILSYTNTASTTTLLPMDSADRSSVSTHMVAAAESKKKLQAQHEEHLKQMQAAVDEFVSDKNNICSLCDEQNYKALYCELCKAEMCIHCSLKIHVGEKANHRRVSVWQRQELEDEAKQDPKRARLPTATTRYPIPHAIPLSKWVKDDDRPYCSRCKAQFTVMFRRHHCRLCGEVFCGNCANAFVELEITPDIWKDSLASIERVCVGCLEGYKKHLMWKEEPATGSAKATTSI